MPLTVFVTGATGTQGGYVARELLKGGHAVHAIARTPDGSPAKALAAAGVKVFPGDFDSVEQMVAAATGCDAAFINVSPVYTDPKGEAKHGQNVVDALKRVGIKRVVQSSVPALERFEQGLFKGLDPDGFTAAYMQNKVDVEKSVKAATFERWAIIRVPRILNCCVPPLSRQMYPHLPQSLIRTANKPETRWSTIDPLDIGRAAVVVLEDGGDKHHGKVHGFSESSQTAQDIADAMNSAQSSKSIRLEYMSMEDAKDPKQASMLNTWELFALDNPEFLDIKNPETFGLKLHTPTEYFRREKELFAQALTPE